MELEKVLRIVATFIACAAFAIWIAAELMFPDSCRYARIPQLIVVVYCLCMVWIGKHRKKQTQLPK